MENNKNKKYVKFQEDMLNFYDFIQVFVFTTNHHLNVLTNNQWAVIQNFAKTSSFLSGFVPDGMKGMKGIDISTAR